MSTEQRNTHFANFARLLLEELTSVEGVFIESINDHWRHEMEEIIARRAHNLVSHAISYTSTRDLARLKVGMLSAQQCADQIPDLTEWPKEAE